MSTVLYPVKSYFGLHDHRLADWEEATVTPHWAWDVKVRSGGSPPALLYTLRKAPTHH